MKNILFVHQSSELYGSDKTLLYLVTELKNRGFTAIVVLPSKGPLYDELEKHDIQIIIAPVIKISRKMFSLKNLVSIPFQFFESLSIIKKQLGNTKIDIVHSNTLAVLTGALFAKKYHIKHLWHVHEIITHPKFISNLYPKIVNYFSDIVIFNSAATQNFMLNKYPKLKPKSVVILNGFDKGESKSTLAEISNFRKNQFHANEDDIIIALVGRISRWKGQQLLLNAFKTVSQIHANIKLVFVGSAPPNQEIFMHSLQEKIVEFKLQEKVILIPFQNEIWKIWESIDLAVVPSTEPEPFGLVAIEAMLASKPVIGANHGGLVEIIIPNETGILFEPNNEKSLENALEKLISNQKMRLDFGKNGEERAKTFFSLKHHIDNFEKVYQNL